MREIPLPRHSRDWKGCLSGILRVGGARMRVHKDFMLAIRRPVSTSPLLLLNKVSKEQYSGRLIYFLKYVNSFSNLFQDCNG